MFLKKRAENGVEYYISDILPCTHAFSTRIGGVSGLSHTSSLNLAFGRGDGEDTVLENVSLFADAVGFNAKELISVPQIHSDIIIDTKKEMLGEGVFRDTDKKGDGYLITESGIFAAV
ncbi:MAG: laccase domain-containing protein, partial [Clostridia bacterium]|nr:laccase domain-containing protein [Clostridia bacterium]